MNETTQTLVQKSIPVITSASHIKLHPYTSRLEGEEYIVSCPEYAITLSMPQIGVEALQLLQQGLTISEVASRMQGDDEQPPDILDFVHMLIEYGLVTEIDTISIGDPPSRKQTAPGFELARGIQGKHVSWLFGIPAFVVYVAMLLAIVWLLWYNPQQVPQMMNMMMFSPWFTVNMLIMIGTIWILSLVHELAHIFAARAFGANARLGFGNRLYYLVSQSYIDNIWQLSRPQRWIVYLAGIIGNLVVFFLSLVLVISFGSVLPMMIYSWLEVILVMVWFATGWQFFFYMKTDIYYLAAEIFQARNLMDDAQAYLGYLLARPFPGRFIVRDLSNVPPRERFYVKIYAFLYVIGIGYACYLLFVVIGPFVLGMFTSSLQTLAMGSRSDLGHLLDAAFTVTIYAGYTVLVAVLMWRHRPRVRLQPKGQIAPPASNGIEHASM